MSTMTLQEAFTRAHEEVLKGDTDFAEGLVASILGKEPNNLGANFLSAQIASSRKQWVEAERAYLHCVDSSPGHIPSYINLVDLYLKTSQPVKAVSLFESIPPELKVDPILLTNLGMAYLKLGRTKEAIEILEQSIQQRQDIYQAWANLARACRAEGDLSRALEANMQAIALAPQRPHLKADYVYASRRACDWATAEPLLDELVESTADGSAYQLPPFMSAVLVEDAAQNLRSAMHRCKEMVASMNLGQSYSYSSPHKKKIKIGYLSYFPDPTCQLTAQLYERHDHRSFQVYVYASPIQSSKQRYLNQIKDACDEFVDISQMDDYSAAARIHEDGIDILINLDGHLQGNRLKLCALRPAPIQISWLGFPGTTGADFMDYMIADKIVIPKEQEEFYSENLIYLPGSYQITNNKQKIAHKKYKRKDFGLAEDAFVFCCFNESYKIDQRTFTCWMQILEQVKNSQLWLWWRNKEAETNLKAAATAAGVDADRIIFSESLGKEEHLERLQLANAGLDTFVCNGHTTTSDVLWAGLPVITLQGTHFSSRVSASLLTNMGVKKLIATTEQEYVKKAVQLAKSPSTYTKLLERIEKCKKEKPLFDTRQFVKVLERVYKRVYDKYLKGEEPASITVREKK